MTRLILSLAIGILLCGVDRACASLIFYADRAAFDAANPSRITIDFENLAPDSSFLTILPTPSITLSTVNFQIDTSTSDGFLYEIGKNVYYPNNSALSSGNSSKPVNNLVIT